MWCCCYDVCCCADMLPVSSRCGGRSGVLEIFIYSFWGTCSPPCARPCAFILFTSFDFPFISFSFLFFIFFFTFIFFFIFSFSFHRHHHRQAGALAGAVDVEDLAVKCVLLFYYYFIPISIFILKCHFCIHSYFI